MVTADASAEPPDTGLAAKLRADLLARHPEAARWGRARAVRAFAADPSLQAVLALRLALAAPHSLMALWRAAFIAFSFDIGRCTIGPGLHLPHPVGIALGHGTVLGRDLTMYQGVGIGFARTARPGEDLGGPTVGDRVRIGPGALLAGEITVGDDSVIGAYAYVSGDVPAGTLVPTGSTWPGDG